MPKSLPPMPSVTRSVSAESASAWGGAVLPSNITIGWCRSRVVAAEQVTSV
jgi:hypothetical protein